MQPETLIYGLPADTTETWREEILAILSGATDTIENVERVKAAAGADGWHSFRIARFNGEKPDFSNVLNI